MNRLFFSRRLCAKILERPFKSKQLECKPTFKHYYVKCGDKLCQAVRLVYENHYKEVTTRGTSEVYSCCPGWTLITNRSHGCNKPVCSKPCLNGGKCVRPELCACLPGFSGPQCENTDSIAAVTCSKPCLNGGKCSKHGICSCLKGYSGVHCEIDMKTHCPFSCLNGGTCVSGECACRRGFTGRRCERDIDECIEEKPCDQICHNTHGSFRCQCREDFVLQPDEQSCKKENDDGGIEAKDLEFELLDKRLLKLETMMGESHKNDVSKDDLRNVYRDINHISEDVSDLKNKINDMENYKSDLHVFKSKLSYIEKKAEKVDDLMLKYDRMKKCAFNNKICI
ncbi:unnamed protein product [Acanthoscelides obtectus]|uniref:Epidermal growth factor-like protein 7 n=1 Tax=Acanthoscelides obtectus TaxID=200917 RepID=A0A9P0KVD0_ACAOB|nr:unnamed protein product [Acanthoscelides obtectus]CAK1640073.1 Fat-like cadherin-related tumor suppressor homolog [Acanthoscelides obtectus]